MLAAVFDFDGVIADSESLHDEALRAVCEPLGFRWEGEPFVGWPDPEVLVHLFAQRGTPLDPAHLRELLDRKTGVVLEQVADGRYRAYPGAVELIRAISERLPVAVCSAGMRAQVAPVLEHFGVAAHLSAMVTIEDTARTKPDPMPYLLAAERIGVAPASCVVVEDSPRGAAAARAAGCVVIGVGHTTAREDLEPLDLFAPTIAGLTPEAMRSAATGARRAAS